MYYSQGYTWRKVNAKGQIIETRHTTPPEKRNLTPVISQNGKRIYIKVPIQDRIITIQAWQLQIGSVYVYLLDTNTKENSPSDQKITDRLYAANQETRLQQEIVLGIGGRRLIEHLGIDPSMYHMNEGHAALLALDLLYHKMREGGCNFKDAKTAVKKKVVFTNHTLVIAGNDLFTDDFVESQLGTYAKEELHVPIQEIISLGKENVSSMFSMTKFAFSLSEKGNAVSKLHAKSARKIWPNNPMKAITNGIYIKRWDNVSDRDDIWQLHQANKRQLLAEIHQQTGQVWGENELLLGWARRMVEYKRPLAVFENMKRFLQVSRKNGQTVRIVFAGEAHASDTAGLELIQLLQKKVNKELKGTVVYLSNYNLTLARMLTSGCDVWLNTPIVGLEACGTSGMKAALNGVLPLTTKDGWFDEINVSDNGWVIDTNTVPTSFLDILEKDIIPLYYHENKMNNGKSWKNNMLRARKLIINDFSATKMLQEYIQKMYIPLIEASNI